MGCTSEEETKALNEKRVFLSEKYIDFKVMYAQDEKYSEVENFIKKNKNNYVRWCAHIKYINKDDNEITLEEEGLSEIVIKLLYKPNDIDSYERGSMITISGTPDSFEPAGIISSSKWNIKNGRIEKTTDEDIEILDKFYAEKKEEVEKKKAEPKVILGSTRDEVNKMFNNYKVDKEYEKRVDANAVKFVNENQIVVVAFDANGKAEGVSFLSSDTSEDGKNSYVNKHYDELLKLATGGKKVKVEKDAVSKYPVELYIGNLHD